MDNQSAIVPFLKRHWLAGLLIGCLLWINQAYLLHPLPVTHDAHHHLARFAHYYLAITEHQWPPRWAGGLNQQFGYPVFNFNYPLPNLLSLPFHLVNLNYETMLKRLTLGSLLLSGLGMYWLVYRQFRSQKTAFMAGLLYTANPYMINLIYARGTIGESLGLAILPWLVDSLLHYQPKPKQFLALSIFTALLFLAHNIFVLMSLPLVVCMSILGSRQARAKSKTSIAIPLLLGIGMSLFFWIPAWFEKSHTILDQVPLLTSYVSHFPRLSQLITSTFDFGYSNPGPVDGLSFNLGLMLWTGLLLATLYLAKSYLLQRQLPYKQTDFVIYILIVIAWMYLLLQISFSNWIWEKVSLMHYLQFPGRLTAIVIFCLSVITAWILAKLKTPTWLYVFIVAFTMLTTQRHSTNPIALAYSNEYWLTYPLTTSLADENMPINFDKSKNYQLAQTLFAQGPVAATPTAQIDLVSWSGSKHQYRIVNTQPVQIIERTAYFPGWQVNINGRQPAIPFSQDCATYPGLLTYRLQPGQHTVTTQFTQNTPARMVGNAIALVSLLALVIYCKVLADSQKTTTQ